MDTFLQKKFSFNNLRTTEIRRAARAFGREPNALPKLCNCYAYSTIKAPDKGEVGGSSLPRPTIQITSKYAAILTFCLSSDLPLKTDLPKICQKSDSWITPLPMGFRSDQTSLNILRETGAQEYVDVKSKSLQRVCRQKESLKPCRWIVRREVRAGMRRRSREFRRSEH